MNKTWIASETNRWAIERFILKRFIVGIYFISHEGDDVKRNTYHCCFFSFFWREKHHDVKINIYRCFFGGKNHHHSVLYDLVIFDIDHCCFSPFWAGKHNDVKRTICHCFCFFLFLFWREKHYHSVLYDLVIFDRSF